MTRLSRAASTTALVTSRSELTSRIRSICVRSASRITVLMPGANETNFFHRAGLDDTKLGVSKKDHPAEVGPGTLSGPNIGHGSQLWQVRPRTRSKPSPGTCFLVPSSPKYIANNPSRDPQEVNLRPMRPQRVQRVDGVQFLYFLACTLNFCPPRFVLIDTVRRINVGGLHSG